MPSTPVHTSRRSGRRRAIACALALAASVPPAAGAGQDAAVAELKRRVELLRESGAATGNAPRLRRPEAVALLYEQREFAPLWTPASAADLARTLREASDDGFDPADYRLARIESLAAGPGDAASAAELDLLRTAALVELAHDLRFGRVEPEGTAARGTTPPPADPDALLPEIAAIARSGRIRDGIADLRPAHFTYRGLRGALADLRRVAAEGGWEPIPAGPTLRAGDADPRLLALRRRLLREGDLPPEAPAGLDRFDPALDAALRRFQHRHGLNPDGVLGPGTLAELNVPVERRIDQLRVNLERARWFTRELPETLVAVNIAGAMVYLVRAGEVVFEARAVVGKPYTRTPIFRASLRYIDLNPTWTVPPGIVGEVLDEVRRDPGYLSRTGTRVLDGRGRPVDVSPSRLSRMAASRFPYVLRQDPGPLNPLGRIKFMFPNRFNVYLHDTPARSLFERESRTFSHGCIRVQDPLRLAELILDDPERWSRADLEAATAGGATRTLHLATPLPVLVLYWTASADLHGELHFYRDLYGRDAAVLRALDGR